MIVDGNPLYSFLIPVDKSIDAFGPWNMYHNNYNSIILYLIWSFDFHIWLNKSLILKLNFEQLNGRGYNAKRWNFQLWNHSRNTYLQILNHSQLQIFATLLDVPYAPFLLFLVDIQSIPHTLQIKEPIMNDEKNTLIAATPTMGLSVKIIWLPTHSFKQSFRLWWFN